MTTYERPVAATLHVHLASGEEWEAKPDDIEKFGLVRRHDAYMAFDRALCEILRDAGLIERDKHITECGVNILRYLAETTIAFGNLHATDTAYRREVMADIAPAVVAIEKALRAAGLAERTDAATSEAVR